MFLIIWLEQIFSFIWYWEWYGAPSLCCMNEFKKQESIKQFNTNPHPPPPSTICLTPNISSNKPQLLIISFNYKIHTFQVISLHKHHSSQKFLCSCKLLIFLYFSQKSSLQRPKKKCRLFPWQWVNISLYTERFMS